MVSCAVLEAMQLIVARSDVHCVRSTLTLTGEAHAARVHSQKRDSTLLSCSLLVHIENSLHGGNSEGRKKKP